MVKLTHIILCASMKKEVKPFQLFLQVVFHWFAIDSTSDVIIFSFILEGKGRGEKPVYFHVVETVPLRFLVHHFQFSHTQPGNRQKLAEAGDNSGQ